MNPRALSVVVLFFLSGCATQSFTARIQFPVKPVQGVQRKLPLRVGYRVPPETRQFQVISKISMGQWIFPLGKGVSKVGMSVLRDVFERVEPASSTNDFDRFDIIVEPRFVAPETHYAISFGGTQAQVAMTLAAFDRTGKIFEQTYTAQGSFSAARKDIPGQGVVVSDALREGALGLYTEFSNSRIMARLIKNRRTQAPVSYQAAARPAPIRRQAPSGVDRPNYRSKERPHDFAIVIGIEDYKDLPDAQFAERDAEAVVAHMRALGVPRRHIIHLSGADASYTAIKKYLNSWLPRNVKPTSRVFFYFSGHGAPNTETGAAYLVPYDGDPAFLDDTAYPMSRLYANLDKLKAKEIIVTLDACFSGAGGRSVLAKGARPLVTKVDIGKPTNKNISILTATSANEITTTLEEERHGMFTYFFLKGLNGAAMDRKGRITAKSLFKYLKPKVQDEARLQNREQTPTVRYKKNVVLRAQ